MTITQVLLAVLCVLVAGLCWLYLENRKENSDAHSALRADIQHEARVSQARHGAVMSTLATQGKSQGKMEGWIEGPFGGRSSKPPDDG